MNLELDTKLIDLGHDERIEAEHATRQLRTVNHLLRRFFGPAAQRRELQILADEVGLGKTYVALGTAFALLSALRDRARCQDLEDVAECYKCVLVITPAGSATLASKWNREGEAFLTRCALDTDGTKWFQSALCETTDELLQSIYRAHDLRRRNQPVLLVAQSNIFTKRLSDPAVRFVTACLFRWWGNGLQNRERYHLVRGLAETAGSLGWHDAAKWAGRGDYEISLWDWTRHERFLAATNQERESWETREERYLFNQISVPYAAMERALNRFEGEGGREQLEQLRKLCGGVPQKRPSDRRTTEYATWAAWFRELKGHLRDTFKNLWPYLLERKFPLVITDEAHHWRNNGAGEFKAIRGFIAPFAKRILLLTATPFQLNPAETVSILNVVEHLEAAIGRSRVTKLVELRAKLARSMENSAVAGQEFSKAWGSLADHFRRLGINPFEMGLVGNGEHDPRTEQIRAIWARLTADQSTPAHLELDQIPGAVRPFFRRALELWRANLALRSDMRQLIIRHRRSNSHRRYWVGREYPAKVNDALRPDYNRLHLSPGQSLEPREELVQYLLMKVVAARSRGRERTTLGSALTGCYSTMWQSKEGREAIAAAGQGDQVGLISLLEHLTGNATQAKDSEHPKLRRVVHALMERWERGEKSLVFCFRVPTAKAIYAALNLQIEDRLNQRRKALFLVRGTEIKSPDDSRKAMQQFRRSLTAKESSGVPLFLDRVLLGWCLQSGWPLPELTEDDVRAIASLAARAEVNGRTLFPDVERPDRVFLARALEHVWAKRLLGTVSPLPATSGACRLSLELLEQIAQESWVRYRYGRPELSKGVATDGAEETERAAKSSLAAHYDLTDQVPAHRTELLTQEFLSRFHSERGSVLASLTTGPNLFAPFGAVLATLALQRRNDAEDLRKLLFALTLRENRWDWSARREAVDALVRALLRDDILLRMPASVFAGLDETWASRLFAGLHLPFGTQAGAETLAQRVVAFLEELSQMSEKERGSYLGYAMRPTAQAVELVQGETKDRSAIFAGFNTPLLPEILVCTAVGQEGIDLHRECRHVVHYDMGWNPATIEQRTGRTDRIGSKTERERREALRQREDAVEQHMPGLDVALPYLAATYDERMFEALRTRAQVFEILTGGDPTVDCEEDQLTMQSGGEGLQTKVDFVPLPQEMLDSLKVDLSLPVRPSPD